MKPKVLILDEPTAGLDPKGRDDILEKLASLHKENPQMTILFVSHSMEDIARNVDKILVMNNSKLFCYDETARVFHRSQELMEMGLSVPQITRVFNRLRDMGIDMGEDIYTLKYAKNLLLQRLEQTKGKEGNSFD